MHTKNTEPQQSQTFTQVHEQAAEYLLLELTARTDFDNDLFEDLFYDRAADYCKLTTMLENARESKSNFTIVGRSGVGKTSLLYKLTHDTALHARLNIAPLLVDYRAAIPRNWRGCIVRFVETANDLFKSLGRPINTLKDNTTEHIDQNVNLVYRHITSTFHDSSLPQILIILDDFDYADDDWFQILDYFMPFAANTPVSVILSIRPPLLAAIQDYDNRFSFHFTKNVNRIDISPLEVREVLASRFAPLMVHKQNDSIFGWITKLFKRPSLERRITKKLGIASLSELRAFEYPFTEKHNVFMREITDGDLRETFAIAYESLCYVLREYQRLPARVEDGHERRVIGKEGTLRLLYDNTDSTYRLMNINEHTSRAGNSLFYNVLEAIKILRLVDPTFYDAMRALGHNGGRVDYAIHHLLDKSRRLIEPVRIAQRSGSTHTGVCDEFIVTGKGEKYLEMAKWPEYIERCGPCGASFIAGYEK